MKDDPIISALINFLVPVILLLGTFFFCKFTDEGFLAAAHSFSIFVSAAMIVFASKPEISLAGKNKKGMFLIKVVVASLGLIYIITTLFSLTDFLSI